MYSSNCYYLFGLCMGIGRKVYFKLINKKNKQHEKKH